MKLEFYGDPPPPSTVSPDAVDTRPAPDGDVLQTLQRVKVTFLQSTGPDEVTLRDIVYTPSGFAWNGWMIDGQASITTPATLRHLYHALKGGRPAETLENATVIQAHNRRTYGDWVPCFLRRLVLADDLAGPLLLPADMEQRSYVSADLHTLGIEHRFCRHPVRIRSCRILRQPSGHNLSPTGHLWTSEQLARFRERKLLKVPMPEPGSLVYLSRLGVKSNLGMLIERDTRSALVEEVISSLGGSVVRTEGMNFDDFSRIAGQVETLVADHGAAMCNLVQWAPRRIIELVPEEWWHWSFVPLSKAAGVARYTLLRPQLRDAGAFEECLRRALVTTRGMA